MYIQLYIMFAEEFSTSYTCISSFFSEGRFQWALCYIDITKAAIFITTVIPRAHCFLWGDKSWGQVHYLTHNIREGHSRPYAEMLIISHKNVHIIYGLTYSSIDGLFKDQDIR